MTRTDWERMIQQAKEIGVHKLQFIGGEPTIHPDFAHLVRYAAEVGFPVVEVFSNLIRIPQSMWQLFTGCQVALATSFYSLHAEVHDQITKRTGSQRITLAHIQEALRRGLPLRVGLIEIRADQDLPATEAMLRNLGVTNVSLAGLQGVGRGADLQPTVNEFDGLCGYCHEGKAMVAPDGSVYPCVFSRWLQVGNVHNAALGEIVGGKAMKSTRRTLAAAFAAREVRAAQTGATTPAGAKAWPADAPTKGRTARPLVAGQRTRR
jgi:MoaA/NifB/PqqE/SkfB family radical SAM enzyme